MSRSKQQHKQDAYTTNLLISLLMRFPEIISINFDMARDRCKFAFMLDTHPSKEQTCAFLRTLDESVATYCELTGETYSVTARLTRSGRMSLLEVVSNTTALSFEAIQLICGIIESAFGETLLRDGDADTVREEEMARQEEIIDYLLSHSAGAREDNLIAFREAGKVYVYDK